MFNLQPPLTSFNPYTIPATPDIEADSEDLYVLSAKAGANSKKNPSQFLQWKKIGGLPSGGQFLQFFVCENGEPKQYWFFASEEDPNIEEPEEE
jgi:hypothetical protein